MRNRRFARYLIYLAILLGLAPGCQAFHSYRPVAIQAQDAETGKPIPGAEVHISYPHTDGSIAPWDGIGTTGADGIVRLRAAPFGDVGVKMTVAAPGYLSEEKSVPVKAVEAVEPAHLFEATDKRPVAFVLTAYAEPRPTVELVLPPMYLGTVKAVVQVQDDVPGPPGQRCFRYPVPPSGVVQVTGPALLGHVFPSNYSLKYADGSPLNPHAKDSMVGFWWLRSDGPDQYFFVGTPKEYKAESAEAAAGTAAHGDGSHSSSRGQGGRGRRNHTGSQTPADSGP